MTVIIYLPGGKYSVTPDILQNIIGADGQVDPVILKTVLRQQLDLDLPLDDPRLVQSKPVSEQPTMPGQRPVNGIID